MGVKATVCKQLWKATLDLGDLGIESDKREDVPMDLNCRGDQHVAKVDMDSPIGHLVGMCQCIAGDVFPESQLIGLWEGGEEHGI